MPAGEKQEYLFCAGSYALGPSHPISGGIHYSRSVLLQSYNTNGVPKTQITSLGSDILPPSVPGKGILQRAGIPFNPSGAPLVLSRRLVI